MTPSTVRRAPLALLWIVAGLHAQSVGPAKLVLRVDEISGGPFGGQKSASCLSVYSNSQVVYAQWSNSAAAIVDKATGLASRPEHTSAFTAQLDNGDIQDLTNFLGSKAVKRLSENFGPPHKLVDYFESITVEIPGGKGNSKKLSTREYYVADLEEKTRYPSALILLMDRIDQIEKAATRTGKPAEVPPDCSLNGGAKLAR